MRRFTVTVPVDLATQIKKICENDKASVSHVIKKLIITGLEKKNERV